MSSGAALDVALVAPLILYSVLMTITPGPNNMMLASSGLLFGVRRTVPHMLGISTGMMVLISVVGAGLGGLFAAEPRLGLALKLVGIVYLLYLSWKLWRAGEPGGATAARPLSFHGAAAFQFANPKAWLMALTAIAAFAAPGPGYAARVLFVALVMGVVGFPCISVWAGFGAGIKALMHARPDALRWFNRAMALLTALTVLLIIYE
ncbi:lysine transporter LysE [Sphingomonas oleivorans]|uniref:Lysine transporter LysE n=1 Tax=Sphingomonas oleivorans TaxID=1735121 RepID=A0A2T5G1G0_9SPHN|nr:LysE family translocator [Sphingomonas oleivorans]PTQ12997.1 lysine transporter LysE [Sphingomonas oleivorans]